MSGSQDPLQVLLREMRGSVSPVDAPAAARLRREKTIQRLRALQTGTTARRRSWGMWQRRAIVAAIVLVPVGALGASALFAPGPSAPGAPESSSKSMPEGHRAPSIARAKTPRIEAAPGTILAQGADASVKTAPAGAGPSRPRALSRKIETQELETSTLGEENRLMQQALAVGRSGDDTTEVRLLSEFLNRHPGSPLAENAHVEMFRALRRAGNERAAAEAARRYLSQYPGGMASIEARRLAMPTREEITNDGHSR